jgi:hypothetical protein
MSDENEPKSDDRRAFLSAAGKFALTVPPAMTFLLSTTLTSNAIACSAGCATGNSAPNGQNVEEPPFHDGQGDIGGDDPRSLP